jgi:hypothetical protein
VIQQGHTSLTVSVLLDPELPSGLYDLTAEVWPRGHVGDNGYDTYTDNTCGQITVP